MKIEVAGKIYYVASDMTVHFSKEELIEYERDLRESR